MIKDNIKGLLLGIFIVVVLLSFCMALDSADEINNLNESRLPQNMPKDTIILDNGSNVAVNGSLGMIKVKSSDLVHIKKKYPTITITARPSVKSGYAYRWYTTTWIDYCPHCHRYGVLRNVHKWQARYEQELTCTRCGADYCGVVGKEKYSWSKVYLRRA